MSAHHNDRTPHGPETRNLEPGTVSVVVPTFNNVRLLSGCLTSLSRLTYPASKVEIVVADNGSTDGTAAMLSKSFPHVKRVDLGQNQGFAAACNRGASEASGDYVAFLNDDAVAEPRWLNGLFAGLRAGGDGAVCAASRILSRDGREVEFAGASANLFGVGKPRSAWGWADSLELPTEGSPLLFASGGAMLVHRRTFLDVGGFDPQFFAYFEDVDLGWRLWVLGHKVVYAPNAVAFHTGGATGSRSGAHRRYTLWECNSLATVVKNYEGGNMERILSASLLLLYKRALLAAGEAIDPANYALTGPKDTNEANVERLSKISVAHLASVDRFNRLLPHFMEERRRIQSQRVRSDAEILPLLGRPFERQFAGSEYAEAARHLAGSLDLYSLTRHALPNRIVIVATPSEQAAAREVAASLKEHTLVALALIGTDVAPAQSLEPGGYTLHTLPPDDPSIHSLLEQANAIVALPGASALAALARMDTPVALASTPDNPGLITFALNPTTR